MSRHGTTEKVVEILRERLGVDTTMAINLEQDKVPDLNNFKTVIVGGSVHGGAIQDELTDFCHRNIDDLLKKRVGLFMCFMNYVLQEEEFEDSFPLKLRAHAIAKGLMGGEFLFEKMNEQEKLAVRRNKGIDQSVYKLDHNAIENFIKEIQG
ncbi:MAG TPA: flavodoxin domain-containing protein [Cyclobacteriaceae bacterium]|nr:flavodoxin domain-containing protein [Cyclobacteriaceae bacterium]